MVTAFCHSIEGWDSLSVNNVRICVFYVFMRLQDYFSGLYNNFSNLI